jgi:uncharacterized protein (TIGR01777 family)
MSEAVLISGTSGLIGSRLVRELVDLGAEVRRLVRPGGPVGVGTVAYDIERDELATEAVENLDAVIHLAGENIASGKWTNEMKQRLYDSRVKSTSLLCSRIKEAKRKPRVLITASAVGYYGNCGSDKLDESSPSGSDFLAELTRDWEAAASSLSLLGVRVVHLRFGVVLDQNGGALKKMLPIFRSGLGGKVGSGKQWMSWLTLDDAIGIVKHALVNESLSGPVNAVAPEPITNAKFTRVLAKTLGRPAIAAVPAFVVRSMFGKEMADSTVLASTRALPRKLIDSGYQFQHTTIEEGIRSVILDQS